MRRVMAHSVSILASALVIAALVGCGGGKTVAPPTPMTIEGLPGGIMLEPGAIPAGRTRTVRNADGTRTEVTCPADGPDCVVTVGPDGAAQSTGGTPTVVTYTPIEGLPSSHTLMAGTIPAGERRTVHRTFDTRTEVACPPDGEDCVVTLTADGAESTGGAPTVATYTTLYLPIGHTLTAGTTIPAGESLEITGYSRGRSSALVCPFDGEDCVVVTVGEYDTAEATGGMLYVLTTSNELVWQANNGPDGTSDGAHARGLEGRLLTGGVLNSMLTTTGSAGRAGVQVHSTLATEPSVTPSASWTAGPAPTLGLELGTTAFSSLDPSELGADPGRLPVDGRRGVPNLGTGWNGAALGKDVPGGKTVRAVVHSNIKEPDPTLAFRNHYLLIGSWLALPEDPDAASTEYNLGVFATGSSWTRWARLGVNTFALTARYEGPATGLYTTARYSGSGGDRMLESAEVGSFTASTVIQLRNAGGGNVSMSGSVTDFMENGESLGDWTLNLNNNNGATIPGSDVIFRGSTGGTAGDRSLAGNWSVRILGGGSTVYWAAGTFTGSTAADANDALRIIGAFGTEYEEP